MGWDRDSAGPAGSLASWPGDGSIPNSMGMSLPKDSGGVVHVSLTSSRTGIGRTPSQRV